VVEPGFRVASRSEIRVNMNLVASAQKVAEESAADCKKQADEKTDGVNGWFHDSFPRTQFQVMLRVVLGLSEMLDEGTYKIQGRL
jgi:hypothetical protein